MAMIIKIIRVFLGVSKSVGPENNKEFIKIGDISVVSVAPTTRFRWKFLKRLVFIWVAVRDFLVYIGMADICFPII